MFRSHSLNAIYYMVDLLNTITYRVHSYSPARSDLFYWWLNAFTIPAMDHRTVNWNLFARLSTKIHQHPSTYNIRTFWCKCMWCPRPFLSVLEGWPGYGGVIPALRELLPPYRHKCSGVTHDRESFMPLTAACMISYSGFHAGFVLGMEDFYGIVNWSA